MYGLSGFGFGQFGSGKPVQERTFTETYDALTNVSATNTRIDIPSVTVGNTVGDYIEITAVALAGNPSNNYRLMGVKADFSNFIELQSSVIAFAGIGSSVQFNTNYIQPKIGELFVVRFTRSSLNHWVANLNGIDIQERFFSSAIMLDAIGSFASSTSEAYRGSIISVRISTNGGQSDTRFYSAKNVKSGSVLPDIVGGQNGTQAGSWPADNSEWTSTTIQTVRPLRQNAAIRSQYIKSGSAVSIAVANSFTILNAPAVYSIEGTLPAGLTLNAATGVITGTPTTIGYQSFKVKVTDAQGFEALSNTVVLSVAENKKLNHWRQKPTGVIAPSAFIYPRMVKEIAEDFWEQLIVFSKIKEGGGVSAMVVNTFGAGHTLRRGGAVLSAAINTIGSGNSIRIGGAPVTFAYTLTGGNKTVRRGGAVSTFTFTTVGGGEVIKNTIAYNGGAAITFSVGLTGGGQVIRRGGSLMTFATNITGGGHAGRRGGGVSSAVINTTGSGITRRIGGASATMSINVTDKTLVRRNGGGVSAMTVGTFGAGHTIRNGGGDAEFTVIVVGGGENLGQGYKPTVTAPVVTVSRRQLSPSLIVGKNHVVTYNLKINTIFRGQTCIL